MASPDAGHVCRKKKQIKGLWECVRRLMHIFTSFKEQQKSQINKIFSRAFLPCFGCMSGQILRTGTPLMQNQINNSRRMCENGLVTRVCVQVAIAHTFMSPMDSKTHSQPNASTFCSYCSAGEREKWNIIIYHSVRVIIILCCCRIAAKYAQNELR